MSIVFNNISDEVDETLSVKKGKTTMWKELYYYIEMMKKERKREREVKICVQGDIFVDEYIRIIGGLIEI